MPPVQEENNEDYVLLNVTLIFIFHYTFHFYIVLFFPTIEIPELKIYGALTHAYSIEKGVIVEDNEENCDRVKELSSLTKEMRLANRGKELFLYEITHFFMRY